jgi:hypothetical protein
MASLLNVPGLEQRTDNAFRAELVERSRIAGYNPDYLAAVISFESGFDANVQNRGGSPALGLIQFWRDYFPPVAKRAGMDVVWEDLRRLTAREQLPLVFAYMQGTGRKITAVSPVRDYYLNVFLPAAVGKSESFVIGEKGSTETLWGLSKGRLYDQNAGFDADRDGRYTVGDVARKIERLVADAEKRPRVPVDLGAPDTMPPARREPEMLLAGAGLVFFCCRCGASSGSVRVEPKRR